MAHVQKVREFGKWIIEISVCKHRPRDFNILGLASVKMVLVKKKRE